MNYVVLKCKDLGNNKESEFCWMCMTICIVCATLMKLDDFGYITLMFVSWMILEGFRQGRNGGQGGDSSHLTCWVFATIHV